MRLATSSAHGLVHLGGTGAAGPLAQGCDLTRVVGLLTPEWEKGVDGSDVVNVAATCVGTRALGPGLRSVVWVQGCPFTCAGCISPSWIPRREARLVGVVELVAELLADDRIVGLTFSGGEPMQQAGALAAVARAARMIRDLSVICFTGYRREELDRRPPTPGVPALLAEVDVLVDGRYVAARNDGRGLRGSNNQRVHHMTHRFHDSGYDFERSVRTAEIRITESDILLVGVPPHGLLATLDNVLPPIPPEGAAASDLT